MKQADQMIRHGAPTYRQYDRSCDQWAEWKRQAATLETKELRRHASVSTSNRHECTECFCCAALDVLQEREAK